MTNNLGKHCCLCRNELTLSLPTEAVVAGVVVSVVILTISVTFVVALALIKRWRTTSNLKDQSMR